MFNWWRNRRRERILAAPFPERFRQLMLQNVGCYPTLSAAERQRLEELVQVFVAEKNFEGCGGLQLNDEIRVTIAANACILLLGLDHDLFSGVESILVYPTAVRPNRADPSPFDQSVRIVTASSPLLGEAHLRGPVVLVWDAVKNESRHPHSGHNVVFHEFAHKLDMLDQRVDGTPPLSSLAQHERWSRACTAVYLALQQDVEVGRKTFLDPYGAQSEGEFFAVVTESFFEKPRALHKHHPSLYDVLKEFYNQDPASRHGRR